MGVGISPRRVRRIPARARVTGHLPTREKDGFTKEHKVSKKDGELQFQQVRRTRESLHQVATTPAAPLRELNRRAIAQGKANPQAFGLCEAPSAF
jgi:hypothetical protein